LTNILAKLRNKPSKTLSRKQEIYYFRKLKFQIRNLKLCAAYSGKQRRMAHTCIIAKMQHKPNDLDNYWCAGYLTDTPHLLWEKHRSTLSLKDTS